jgi:hypothetical protein
MTKFKITYNEADTINKTAIVEADSGQEASTIFYIENPNVIITSVEVVTND